jgi:hypothetical protein
MTGAGIPDELRRFLLSGTLSVPHVEAILQLRRAAGQTWNPQTLAARLYVRASRAAELLSDLCEIGVARLLESDAPSYLYEPATPELAMLLDELEYAYGAQLVAVTRLIHSAEERKALNFAAAFRLRKDPT